jgi:hypothetical protein
MLALIAGWTFSATAADTEKVDLTKIDRSIAKEPKYESDSPEYCLLVFGARAETRVWLVMDATNLHVDRNGNGDLTEAGELAAVQAGTSLPRWHRVGEITGRDGKVYRDLRVGKFSDGYRMIVEIGEEGRQYVAPLQAEKPKFAARAKDAPIIHFDGPPSIVQYAEKRVIPRDEKTNSRARALRIMVGTPGLGAGTFAAMHCNVCDDHGPLRASFVYPSADGGPQIEITDALEKIG